MTAIWRIIFHSEAGIIGVFGASALFASVAGGCATVVFTGFAGVVAGCTAGVAGVTAGDAVVSAPSAAVAAKNAKTVCRQNFTPQIIPKSGIIVGA